LTQTAYSSSGGVRALTKLPNFSFYCSGNIGKKDHRELILLVKDSRYSPNTGEPLAEDFSQDELTSHNLEFYVRAQNSTPGSYSTRTYWLDDTSHPLAKTETETTPRAAFYCEKCRRATPPQSKDKVFQIISHQLSNGQKSFNIGLLFES
jgi:hypothetical protein